MSDPALNCLKPYLGSITEPSLFFADESALSICDSIAANPLLTIITNRFDVFQLCQQKNHQVIFSDFNPSEYQLKEPIKHIIYRISKEKPLVHYLLNQATELINNEGSLIISGLKNEGVKTYGDKIVKQLNGIGKLKKQGNAYCGKYQFNQESTQELLDDQQYATIREIAIDNFSFYSKPGVFGWNKIDQGTTLLIACFQRLENEASIKEKSVLDLGCGYGFIGLSIDAMGCKNITATDNNAAALLCAHNNSKRMKTPMQVLPSNCADTISEQFDIILCNPPFHRGFEHDQALTSLFLEQTKHHLAQNGFALLVVNRFIDLEQMGKNTFNMIKKIDQNKSFSVYKLSN